MKMTEENIQQVAQMMSKYFGEKTAERFITLAKEEFLKDGTDGILAQD